jgi:hypothetical protein
MQGRLRQRVTGWAGLEREFPPQEAALALPKPPVWVGTHADGRRSSQDGRMRGPMDLKELALRPTLIDRLQSAGLRSTDDLAQLCDRELLQLRGVGPQTVAAIQQALTAVGMTLAEDPFGRYTCARHGRPAGDAGLTSFFLCRDCARNWMSEAFDGARPEWEGEAVTGYCIACNVRKRVRLRQWLLCAVCERIARSIGRSVEAERAVQAFWSEHAVPVLDAWELRAIDPPRLRRAGAPGAATLDFIASRGGHALIGIELKTGRSEIKGTGIGTRIGRFQLDISDCDAIHDAAQAAHVVPYIIHAQVIDRAEPPTVRHAATGLWWAEYPCLRDAYLETRQRPRENRPAAYFDVGAFRSIDELPGHLAASDPADEVKQLNRFGWPDLYR